MRKPATWGEHTPRSGTAVAWTGRGAACARLVAISPAAEPRIRLLTIFMLTSKLLCREGSGSAGCKHPKVGSLNPLKPALSLRAFGHTRINARDLSEPPNGTTSGCPPPSQHHNYRRLLHTQQRNRSERGESGRFWKGVAQITRSRDRTFIASLCSPMMFSISAI